MSDNDVTIEEQLRDAFRRRDAGEVRRVVESRPELRHRINDPIFGFHAPAIVAFADDAAMVEVLLALGADPNRRSEWWAGPFHALHSATGYFWTIGDSRSPLTTFCCGRSADYTWTFEVEGTAVPEPGSLMLLGSGAAVLVARRRRRRSGRRPVGPLEGSA
jgi:hypothetical protein